MTQITSNGTGAVIGMTPATPDAALAAPFDFTFTDVRGGVELTYISGEQVTSRLNEVLGVAGWNFRIIEHGINTEADEAWALGELMAHIGDRQIIKQQFGSQKIKRSRSTGLPLDIGFDLKGSGTDAMKKCASLLGVGLYLSKREDKPGAKTTRRNGAPTKTPARTTTHADATRPLKCADCGHELSAADFSEGSSWTVGKLANASTSKFGRILCADDYRKVTAYKQPTPVGS